LSGRWDAVAAARSLDDRVADDLDRVELPPAPHFTGQLRFYLQRMTDCGKLLRGARSISQRETAEGYTQIDVGPTIYRATGDDCLILKSGARMSLGITLRIDGSSSRLLAYRFHLELLPSSGLRFVRIDLNAPKSEYDPMHIPRSHIHPGFENVHVPFPAMHPWQCWTGSSM
jgi:hypothetical protein